MGPLKTGSSDVTRFRFAPPHSSMRSVSPRSGRVVSAGRLEGLSNCFFSAPQNQANRRYSNRWRGCAFFIACHPNAFAPGRGVSFCTAGEALAPDSVPCDAFHEDLKTFSGGISELCPLLCAPKDEVTLRGRLFPEGTARVRRQGRSAPLATLRSVPVAIDSVVFEHVNVSTCLCIDALPCPLQHLRQRCLMLCPCCGNRSGRMCSTSYKLFCGR